MIIVLALHTVKVRVVREGLVTLNKLEYLHSSIAISRAGWRSFGLVRFLSGKVLIFC